MANDKLRRYEYYIILNFNNSTYAIRCYIQALYSYFTLDVAATVGILNYHVYNDRICEYAYCSAAIDPLTDGHFLIIYQQRRQTETRKILGNQLYLQISIFSQNIFFSLTYLLFHSFEQRNNDLRNNLCIFIIATRCIIIQLWAAYK